MAAWMAPVLLVAGCSSTSGPFGREKLALSVGPSYVGGRGMQMFPNSNTLLTNVKDAMSDTGVHSIIQNEDPGGTVILEGRIANDRKVRVTVQASGVNALVSAKVGWTGDETVTRLLLDKIASRQGTIAPPPTPAEVTAEAEANAKAQKLGRFSKDAISDAEMLHSPLAPNYIPSAMP
jgi:hypothetical protein